MKLVSLHVVFIFALIIFFTPGPEQRLQYALQDKSSPQTHVMYSLQKGGEVTPEEIEETRRRNYNVILTGVQKPVLDGPKSLELVRIDSWSFYDQHQNTGPGTAYRPSCSGRLSAKPNLNILKYI